MSNLLQSFYNFVTSDSSLSALVGTRVFRDKVVGEVDTPFIIYERESTKHPFGNYSNTYSVKQTTLVIEVVGLSSEQTTLDTIRNTLISKLGGMQGELTTDWQGRIEVMNENDMYDADTERCIRRLELKCTEIG